MKMANCPDKKNFELMFVIVNFGLGSKVLKKAKNNGVSGGTICLGKGTVKNHLLEILALSDIRKEIVVMIAEKSLAYNTLEIICKDFKMHKPNHGIAFTTSLCKIVGYQKMECNSNKKDGGADTMYKAIFTIVDKGKAEEVIDAATKAGSRGGTIINARGSGIHETSKLFSMEIEPEKEIVLILSEINTADAIIESISQSQDIEKPGNGIIFVLDVNKTYGIN